MSDSEVKLFYAQSSEVKNRILAPDEHLRAIDTGAYYVAGPDGKPQAVLTATTSAQGVVIFDAPTSAGIAKNVDAPAYARKSGTPPAIFDFLDTTVLADWNSDATPGFTYTVDTAVLWNGRPTLRIDIPAGTSGAVKLFGCNTAAAKTPFGFDGNGVSWVMKSTNPALFSTANLYMGDLSMTNAYIGAASRLDYVDADFVQPNNWHFWKWGSAAAPALPAGAGTPSWTQRMRTKLVCTLTASAQKESIWIAALGAIPLRKKGGIVVSFDDGMKEMYDVIRPLAKHYGIPVTLFVNGKAIATRQSDRITPEQLQEMNSDTSGLFAFTSHGWEHWDYETTDKSVYFGSFDKNRDWLRSLGVPQNTANIVGYPFGHANYAEYDEFIARGYWFGRHGAANYAASRVETFGLGDRQSWLWNVIASLQTPNTVAQVIDACRRCGTNKSVGYLIGHVVGATDTTYGWQREKIEELFAQLAADRDEGLYDLWRADDIAIEIGM